VSFIVRRYTDYMKIAAHTAVLFITFFHIILVLFCIIVYVVMFRMQIFNVLNYVFLLLCLFTLTVTYVPF
jgi:hypothetical protein